MGTNPYSILGITPEATDEEVKRAYRAMSRKYHPDANINSPNPEYVEEKFKEVQQAYQQIMKEREEQSRGYSDYSGWGNNYESENSQQQSYLNAATNYIRSGHYREALNVLDSISERSAFWYFLSASANSGLGNNVLALDHARMAVQMEPNNMQYRAMLSQLESGGNWYESMSGNYGRPIYGGGSWCLKIALLNLFCNCLCGGGGMCFGGNYRPYI